jgi:tetratricopeptide (TPR) repeat protein
VGVLARAHARIALTAEALEAVVDLETSDPNAIVQAAYAAQTALDWPTALRHWERLRTAHPDYPLAYTAAATALRELGELDAAEHLAEQAVTRFPDVASAAVVWAEQAERRQDWPGAAERWAAVRQRFPRDGHGYVRGAHALQQFGRLAESDLVLQEGRRQCPTDPWVMATWGYFAQHHLDLDEAMRRWRDVREFVPHHPVGFSGAALTLRDRRRFVEAEAMTAGAMARFPDDPGGVVDYASIADAAGDWLEAVRRWDIVRRRFPDQQAGYTRGAVALAATGRQDEADTLLTEAANRFRDQPSFLFECARVSQARQNWAGADQLWTQARERFPQHLEPWVEGARVRLALGALDQAEALLGEAQTRFPADPTLAVAAADLAQRRGDWPLAVTRWQAVRAARPGEVLGIVELSRALQRVSRIDEADTVLADAMVQFPARPPIALAWAELAMQRELWPEAVRRWETVRQQVADEPQVFVRHAEALDRAGRSPDAEALLAQAADRFPDQPGPRIAWADLASRGNDWAEAVARWEQVRQRFPGEVRSWIENANALANTARPDAAETLFQDALSRFPASLEVMLHWALLGNRHQATDVALQRWERLRDTFPDQPQGYVFGAYALQDSNHPDAAETLITAALQRFPANAEILRAAGEIALRRGAIAVAADRFRIAAERLPADLTLMRRWVEALASLQRQDEARAVLETALRIWPSDRDFLLRRVRLEILLGHPDTAVAVWRAAIAGQEPSWPLGYELGWTMFSEGLPPEMARTVLRFLVRQPDTGARDWLPVLAAMVHLRGLRPPLAHLARDTLDAEPDLAGDPATLDVLRAALLYEYTDADMQRFLRDYAARGRTALTAHMFCQNYWKAKPDGFARFTGAFEQYMAARWQDPSWINAANATEVLACLNFAAVHSDAEYARLVQAMRERLDLPALQAAGLHTIPGVVGTIGQLARIDAPAVLSAPQRLRIAVCVSGQLRGYPQALATWGHLGLQQHDVSVFVHVWQAIGRNWQKIWLFAQTNQFLWDTLVGGSSVPFLRDRFPRLAAAALAVAGDNVASVADLRAAYGTDFVRIEDDTRDQFRFRHNLWKMHYKVEQAHRFAREDGRTFDLMIRIRPDRSFRPGAAPDWAAIRAVSAARNVVFADFPSTFTERQTWLGDQFAAGTPEVMDVYSSVWSAMETCTRAGAFPPDMPDQIRPHSNLFYHCFHHGLLGRTMPDLAFGDLLDPVMLSVADVLRLAREDVGSRTPDEFDRQFLAAAEAAA